MRQNTQMPNGLQILGIDQAGFAKAVKDFRARAGYTCQDMAYYIGGVHPATINRWERGLTVPTSRMVIGRLKECKVI